MARCTILTFGLFDLDDCYYYAVCRDMRLDTAMELLH